jgi:hypothetical protein
MQRGACEAVWLAKPIITSDWPVLRTHFHKGTVFVDNSVKGIQQGIQAMRKSQQMLTQEIFVLQQERRKEWQGKYQALMSFIRGSDHPNEGVSTTVAQSVPQHSSLDAQ